MTATDVGFIALGVCCIAAVFGTLAAFILVAIQEFCPDHE